MLQVIIITRLHAMHQPSRKILSFIIVTFLAVNIFGGIVVVMIIMHTSGGTLNCGWRTIRISLMNTSGIDSLWHPSVRCWLHSRYPTFEFHWLDTFFGVGGPCTVSHSLDGGKTLPWTAATFDKKDCQGLFHNVDQNSHALFCEVSSYCDS